MIYDAAMFETLSKGFRSAKQRLTGKATLDEATLEEALRDVRISLLEADVDYKVTQLFLDRVKAKVMGEVVQLKAEAKGEAMRVTPDAFFVKACQDELAALIGPVDTTIRTAKRGPSGIMMVGLQGSGKTTTTGKLARYLEKKHKKPLLVAADVYRPAAIEQLQVLGQQLGMPVYAEPDSKDPVGICERGYQYAKDKGRDIVLYDTAGRLAIDELLMKELEQIDEKVRPDNIFLVIDAMIGQSAVETARVFNERLDLDGVILTKLDGDARGGSALSVKEVTGAPIKFLGMGESLDKLEEFRPEGLASRILGMGDLVGLMKDFEEVVDAEKAEKDAMRMLKGKFDMADFLEQISIIQKMGSLRDIFDKMPFFPGGLPQDVALDDKELDRIKAMINSMTSEERRQPELFIGVDWEEFTAGGRKGKRRGLVFDSRRVARVARGSGRKELEVKELINKFGMMRQMMMELGQSSGLLGKLPGFKQLGQMKRLAGLDMNQLMGMAGPMGTGGGGGGSSRPPARAVDRFKEKRKRQLQKKARKAGKKKK